MSKRRGMMKLRKAGRSGKRSGVQGSGPAVDGSVQSFVTRTKTISVSFNAAGFSGSTGLLNTEDSGGSVSGANSVFLDPFTVGGRMNDLAGIFQEYRIKSGVVRYRTTEGMSGTVPSTSLAAVKYDPFGFTYGLSRDPAFAPANFDGAVQYGGKVTASDRNSTVHIPSTGWLFCDQVSSPSVADLRQCSFALLFGFLSGPANYNTGIMGYFSIELETEWRYPRETANIGIDERNAQAIANFVAQHKPKLSSAAQELKHEALDKIPELKQNGGHFGDDANAAAVKRTSAAPIGSDVSSVVRGGGPSDLPVHPLNLPPLPVVPSRSSEATKWW